MVSKTLLSTQQVSEGTMDVRIFLWQNYSHLSLVSEVATWKCSDFQELLSLSGISINARKLISILLRMKTDALNSCIEVAYTLHAPVVVCSVSYKQKHHFVFQILPCTVVWVLMWVELRSSRLSQRCLLLVLGLWLYVLVNWLKQYLNILQT